MSQAPVPYSLRQLGERLLAESHIRNTGTAQRGSGRLAKQFAGGGVHCVFKANSIATNAWAVLVRTPRTVCPSSI